MLARIGRKGAGIEAMTHYTVKFSNFPEAIRPLKALQEIISYIGEEKFIRHTEAAIADIRSGVLNRHKFILCVALAGVQGYPAGVWFDYADQIAITLVDTPEE